MTLDELMNFLLNHLRVGQREAVAAIEATAKMIAFKYEAELYKIFAQEDIEKANALGDAEAQTYLHDRYEAITGSKSDVLLTKITDMVVAEVVKQPRDYFHFSESV